MNPASKEKSLIVKVSSTICLGAVQWLFICPCEYVCICALISNPKRIYRSCKLGLGQLFSAPLYIILTFMNTHFLLVLQPNNLGLYPYYLLKRLFFSDFFF